MTAPRTTLDSAAFQILESAEADFETMTWTFKLGANNHVGGGYFAVMPSNKFMDMSAKLANAEGLLKQILDGDQGGATWRERAQRYFDPAP